MTPSGTNEGRRLVPRWRTVATTVRSKELAQPIKLLPTAEAFPDELVQRITKWRRSPSLLNAAELLEAAIVTGHENEAVEAARRLLHPDMSARTAIQMQAAVLLTRTGHQTEVPETLRTSEPLDARMFRSLVRANPLDSIAWVELALQQTVRRQIKAAKRSMSFALHLAPHNRHILRSAARLYLHDQDPERGAILP